MKPKSQGLARLWADMNTLPPERRHVPNVPSSLHSKRSYDYTRAHHLLAWEQLRSTGAAGLYPKKVRKMKRSNV
jgi:hypothetical protein